MTGWVWLGVGLLGGIGALGRFLLDAAVSLRLGRRFPVGTLVVNVSDAFLLGLLAGLGVGGRAILLVGTATLGSYTTFSTWMLGSVGCSAAVSSSLRMRYSGSRLRPRCPRVVCWVRRRTWSTAALASRMAWKWSTTTVA